MEYLGHDAPPTNFWRENLISGAPLARCPLRTLLLARDDPASRPVAEELDRYLDVYWPAYESGFLLEAGGVSDQPARYWELIGLIRDVRAVSQAKHDALRAPEGA